MTTTDRPVFDREAVQTISDWQRDGTPAQKTARAQKLKDVASRLPPYFCECDAPCFRQETHRPDRTFQVLIDDQLPEAVSSWTLDIAVAKAFKGGVPFDNQGIILWVEPLPQSVIANLDRIYRTPEFQEALCQYGPEVDYFFDGAGKYGNSQREVVLELGSLSRANILSYGGFSGSHDQLVQAFELEHGRHPDELELEQLMTRVGQPWWLDEEGTRNVVSNTVVQFLDRVRVPDHSG